MQIRYKLDQLSLDVDDVKMGSMANTSICH